MDLKVDKTRAFMPWERKYRGIHAKVYMLRLKLLVETLHSPLRRIVVLAEMTKHDVLDLRMVHLGEEPGRLNVAQMSERT